MSMVLIIVILYEVLSVFGVGLWLRYKRRGQEETGFINANQSLGVVTVGVTLGLTFLGSLHVFGVMELGWFIGMSAMWVSIAHVILICLICLTTGRWVRRLKVSTVPEMLNKLFGSRVRVSSSCVLAAVVFAMLTMEAQAIGIVLSSLTGLTIVQGAVIGGVIGLFYVLLAGMEEIGIVNVINTVVMFSGLILAGLVLGGFLPNGWDGVQAYYETTNQMDKLRVLGTPQVILAFGIPTVLAVVFAQGISQQGLQVCMAAKNERTVVKAMFLAAILNGTFTILTVGIGIAAASIPELQELGPKSAGPALIVNYLPDWLVIWLCASFLGALLSTFATNVMAPATLFVKDIYVSVTGSTESEAKQAKKVRLMILILGIIAIGISFFLPPMVEGANWVFSWLIPVFWITVFGLLWKRSRRAAEITLFGSWIINLLWTFTPLADWIGMGGVMNAYVMLAASLILGIISNMACGGEKGLFTKDKQPVTAKTADI